MPGEQTERTYSNIEQLIALGRVIASLQQYDKDRVAQCGLDFIDAMVEAQTEDGRNIPLIDIALYTLWNLVQSMPIRKLPEPIKPCLN